MKDISKREGIMLLILGMVLIGYLYYSLFYEGIYKKVEASKSNIKKYTQEVNDAKLNKELSASKTSQLKSIKSKYEEAKLILPQLEMNPEIVAGIQKFMQRSTVQVKSITLGQPEEIQSQSIQNGSSGNSAEKLLTVPVSIFFTSSSYEEAMNFIALFENDKRLVQVTNTIITANRTETLSLGEGSAEKQSVQIAQPLYKGINFGKAGTNIEVSLVIRYYYASNYLH